MDRTIQFEIDGYLYRVRGMDAFTQLAVFSKISPLLHAGVKDLVPLLTKVREGGVAALGGMSLDAGMAALGPVTQILSKMDDTDRMAIFDACLDLVERQKVGETSWAKIWSPAAQKPMFADINESAVLILQIVFQVMKGTFQRFFDDALRASSGAALD